MSKKIVISGANGFIGRHLCTYFVAHNYCVYGLVRQLPINKVEGVHYQKFDLEAIDDTLIKEDYHALIHAAYIPDIHHSNSSEINISASKKLYELCLERTIHFVFLSSLSALPTAQSNYGKSKYRIEQLLDIERACIVRPGLVIGDGGLYQNMRNVIQKTRFLPLFGGGKQVIQQVQVNKLCELIFKITDKTIVGEYSFAEKNSVTMKEWYRSIAKTLNKKVFFIPIPYFIADILFTLIELLPFNFGVGKENYLGLKQMKERKISSWDL